jgi:hypothetical protein
VDVNPDWHLRQDKWTVNRFTISAGLRYDNFIQGFPGG